MAGSCCCAEAVLRCLLRAHPELEGEVREVARASAEATVDALVAAARPRRVSPRMPANTDAPVDAAAMQHAAVALRRLGVGVR